MKQYLMHLSSSQACSKLQSLLYPVLVMSVLRQSTTLLLPSWECAGSLSAGVSSAGSSSTGRECSEAQMRAAASAESQRQQQADWSAASLPLNPVLGPTDHSLRLMMPVIVFAIIRGFDELLPVLPPLVFRIPSLENLLVVDLGDSVTLNVRPHHMHSLRKLWASRLMRSSRPLGVRPMLLAQHSVRASPSMPLVATGAGSVPGYALGGSGRIPMTNELVQDFVQPVHTDGPGTRDSSSQYLSVHTQHTLSQAVGVGPQEATQLTLPATAEAGGTAVAAAAQPSSQGPPAEIQMAAGSGELTEESVQLVTEPEQVAEEREQLEEEGEGTVAAAAPRPIPLGVQAAAQLVVGPVQRLRHELSLSSDLDISFWRADEASVCSWKVKDISVCIAANGSTPLSSEELSTLADTAFGGQLLAATMSRVNGKRGASFL